ncbi:MAG: hypothetical protein IPL28_19265 [Chloroflexi bacterium]|nr:hypothetical protein [Chloroflexota bacterium]
MAPPLINQPRSLARPCGYAAAIGLGLLLSWYLQGGDTLLGQPASFMMHYSIFGHLPDFLVGMVAAVLFLQSKPRPWLESRARWLVWGNCSPACWVHGATALVGVRVGHGR